MIDRIILGVQKVLAESGSRPTRGSGGSSPGAPPIDNPLGAIDSIEGLIHAILNIVVQIGLPVIALAIVYCGFLFVKAQGNESELTKAKTALFYTVIGAAVVLGAFVIQQAIIGTINQLK